MPSTVLAFDKGCENTYNNIRRFYDEKREKKANNFIRNRGGLL